MDSIDQQPASPETRVLRAPGCAAPWRALPESCVQLAEAEKQPDANIDACYLMQCTFWRFFISSFAERFLRKVSCLFLDNSNL